MKRFLFSLILVAAALVHLPVQAADAPLRIFIRSGPKSHGPGAHDHPAFLKDWVPMLQARGAVCEGGNEFPTKEQLDKTDVLILHTDNGGDINIGPERKNLQEFIQRGGGVVSIHAANVSKDHDWFKTIVGGSWHHKQTKWLEGEMSLYFTDRENPITKDISNFDMDDEIYYDMDVMPEVKILAAAYTPNKTGARNAKKAEEVTKGSKQVSVYDIQPQMWTYERNAEGGSAPYRAFVCIPGHYHKNFSHNGLRTALLRGIAWAGKRSNVDELCKPEELGDALRYVEGGTPRAKDLIKELEVHPEFDISLVATEPLINKPMNVDWDEKGRLWVCETPEYPNGLREPNKDTVSKDVWKDSGSLEPGKYDRAPQDRISILTDTDGDGQMDKKQVFADKLELATSFVFYKNGVIVSSAPDIWLLEDTNGDDVADKRSKLYTGLGTGDTHAVINNLRWGLDGWVYATHGYSSGHVTSPDGTKDFGVDGAGVVRFKPDGSAFEQYASRGGNTWGLNITWDGNVFYTQPTSGNHFIHVVLPETVLAKGKLPGVMGTNGMLPREPSYPSMHYEQQAYVQIDQVGSFTAAAGCAIYEGGAWPERWNKGYFVTEPTINIVSHFMVEPDGVTFKAKREPGREQTEFIRSKNLWFRPIEVRVGPDGALYVVDFCNQAIIHNDTRGPQHGPANAAVRPDRDHYFGRIWKVQHKQAKKIPVPVMDKSKPQTLIDAYHGSPSVHVKMNAVRLAAESDAIGKEKVVINDFNSAAQLGLRALQFGDKLPKQTGNWKAPLQSFTPEQKALLIGKAISDNTPLIADPNGSLSAILGASDMLDEPGIRAAFITRYINSTDDWTKSAIISAGSDHAAELIADSLAATSVDKLQSLVAALTPIAVSPDKDKDHAQLVKLLQACADAPGKADALKATILGELAGAEGANLEGTPALKAPLQKLLAQASISALALPLAAKWDSKNKLAEETGVLTKGLLVKLADSKLPDAQRVSIARSLLSIRKGHAEVMPAIEKALTGDGSEGFKKELLAVLGEQEGPEIGKMLVASLTKAEGQPAVPMGLALAAFDQILKRPNWTNQLLDAVEKDGVKPADLGPANVARLRTHPNKQVSARANQMLEKLSPTTVAKNQVIAQLTPEVEKPGDVAKGKLLFTACAVCHKLGDTGLAVGPPLDGMGAHGPAELLTHIIDPNREVDPSFWAHNIITKKGDVFVGVITSENSNMVTLATQIGVKEIAKSDIDKRENTRRSLMPEGFEALGAEALRDLLSFMCGGEQKFRVVDLRNSYNADSRRGLFAKEESVNDSVHFAKFGNVTAGGVPWFIMDPQRSPTGLNLIVLKGGGKGTAANQNAQRVAVPMNAAAKQMHLLSGIAGWGWPATKDDRMALRVTVNHKEGEAEVFELKNGVAFADYNRELEVPGSALVEGLVNKGQLRRITLPVKNASPISEVVFESLDNGVTPVIAAVTADLSGEGPKSVEGKPNAAPANPNEGPKQGAKGDGPLAPAKPITWEAGKTKVLVIGGGSSHDFAKFFGGTDVETLKAAGFSVNYTEDRDQAPEALKEADVAVISVNRKFFDTPAYRQAVMAFTNAGKGLVMLHPGTWFGYGQWPELNAQIVGGGSRGHDKLGPFLVNVAKAEHPVMAGVPASFEVVDELYYMNAEPHRNSPGTAAIEVLAETSPSEKYGKPHPSVWITQHAKARIVGIALGHDQRVHDLPAFRAILTNAVKWAGGK